MRWGSARAKALPEGIIPDGFRGSESYRCETRERRQSDGNSNPNSICVFGICRGGLLSRDVDVREEGDKNQSRRG